MILAIVPARGGSKGIPRKNIRDLNRRPLLYYQIMNGLNSKADKVIVSTDDQEIASIAGEWCDVLLRPSDISTDESKSEETLLHAVSNYPDADIVVMLQPTSPLTKVESINECIDRVVNGDDSSSCFVSDYGFFLDDFEEIVERPMRQYKKSKLRETGCCFATKTNSLVERGNRVGVQHGIVMVSKEESFEIDDWSDLRICEALIEKGDYFNEIDIPTPSFEEEYWSVITDPDGKVRDLALEREKKLAWHAHVIDYVNLLDGKILDIGCGLGHMLSGYHDGFEKYGVDISAYARDKASQYGTILPDTATLPDDTFDVVTLINVFEHLHQPENMIKEIWRLLKPGGKFIIETADFDSATGKVFGDNFRMHYDVTHTTEVDLLGTHRLLLDNLFEVEKIEYPFFDTEYATEENLLRVFDTHKMSPPFPGNIFTLFCYKK